MGSLNKRDILNVIDKRTKDLHQEIDRYRSLLANILDKGVDDEAIKQHPLPLVTNPGERRLKEAIREAIEVLDESRKAFKSKKLELLRKKLTDVLIELE